MSYVRAIYLVPPNKEINPAVPIAISNALKNLQFWYFRQLGRRKTFRLFEPTVETFKTDHHSDWYGDHQLDADERYWFFYNVLEDGFKLTEGKFYDQEFIWIYYIEASPKGDQYGGSGTSSVAVLHQDDIEGLLGRNSESISRWIGGLGHELGHAFGLDHPSENESEWASRFSYQSNSLMMHGFRNYPVTYLTEEDQQFLTQSSFFHNYYPDQEKFSPHDLLNK